MAKRRLIFLLAVGFAALAMIAATTIGMRRYYPIGITGTPPPLSDPQAARAADATWNGKRALADIVAQLRHVPRAPGTPGQAATVAYIETELRRTGRFQIVRQEWQWRRRDGVTLPLVNVVARLDPEKAARIIVGTHHDSIVRAWRDPVNPNGPMPGAHNGASGVAVLLETARALAAAPRPPEVGVDLVFFDGEEGPFALGGGDPHWEPLGSPHFVRSMTRHYVKPPVAVVILDLVCRHGQRFRPEQASLRTGREELARLWAIGERIAPDAFNWRAHRGGISDDHTAFVHAGLPAVLLIDWPAPGWFNTTQDTADKCSADGLSTVGRTVTQYLYSLLTLCDF